MPASSPTRTLHTGRPRCGTRWGFSTETRDGPSLTERQRPDLMVQQGGRGHAQAPERCAPLSARRTLVLDKSQKHPSPRGLDPRQSSTEDRAHGKDS